MAVQFVIWGQKREFCNRNNKQHQQQRKQSRKHPNWNIYIYRKNERKSLSSENYHNLKYVNGNFIVFENCFVGSMSIIHKRERTCQLVVIANANRLIHICGIANTFASIEPRATKTLQLTLKINTYYWPLNRKMCFHIKNHYHFGIVYLSESIRWRYETVRVEKFHLTVTDFSNQFHKCAEILIHNNKWKET